MANEGDKGGGGLLNSKNIAAYGNALAKNMKDLRWWGDFLARNALYIVVAFLVIFVHVHGFQYGYKISFISFWNFTRIINGAFGQLFLALGVGGIIVLGGADLSAGRIMGLTACICASLLQRPVEEYAEKMFPGLPVIPIFIVLLIAMAFGGIVGIANGFFVAKFKLHPFLVTLAMQLIMLGAVLYYVTLNGTSSGRPISHVTEEYKVVVKGAVYIGDEPIPYYVFYAIMAAVAVWFMWNKTTLGKNMFAVGANPKAANVSGISVMATTMFVFMIAGLLYGVSGFVEAARIGSNSYMTGVGAELDAIAACAIGGVSLRGGVGKIRGIIAGIILLQVFSVSVSWLGISGNLRYIIMGVIIIAACATNMRKYR